jgi:predicted dehydrogenase
VDAVGERYHIDRRYTDWNDLLANDDLDAVVIAHSGSHRDSVMAALDANKHLLVEKPLAWTVRETEEVVARAEQSDRIVQLGYHKLYDPAFNYARQQIDAMPDIGFVRITVLHPANELGFSPYRLRRGDGRIEEGHQQPGPLDEQYAGQVQAFAGAELGPLIDEVLGPRKDETALRVANATIILSLIHQIYMLYKLIGEPERVLSTDIWRGGFSLHSVIQMPGDLRCTMDWHYLSYLKDYREEYAVYGHHERVLLDFPSPYFRNFPSPVTVQGGDGELSWEKRVTVSHAEAFENELLAFYDNVINNTQPISTVQDALKHVRFAQELLEAARV